MTVQTQSGSQILSNFATAVQGAAKALIDFSVGSILRAIGQGVMGIALWLQGLGLQAAALARFATSYGADADSWGAQFKFPRLPPKPSSGSVTLARFTPTNAASAQAAMSSGTDSNGNTIWTGGAIVETLDGSVEFMLIPDTTQTAYSATTNTYSAAAGISSITATVVCTQAGSVGNVAEGAIELFAVAIPGFDTVTNGAVFENGADAELDPAYKARFPAYLDSLSDGTPAAIRTAVENVQQKATCGLIENEDYAGAPQVGYFTVIVDDGSGDPPSSFQSAAANAIEATRPIATTYGVFAPTILNVAVVLTLTVASGYTHAAVAPIVQAAIEAYMDALTEGQTLPWSKIPEIAWDASPGVANITNWTLNGGTADIVPSGLKQVIKYSSVTVN
ncbi:MAG TPA: baseplate J/gp47 family protein [Gemmatimonadales bacterium]|nr:baseplate J/gp47 family protein [Gemmatimonadales bacterium]